MKRFIVVLLVALLTVSSFALVASAAGTANASVSSSQTVKPGDTVTLTVTVSGEFSNYELTVGADAGLTVTGISGVIAYGNNVAFFSPANVTSSQFAVTVKVAEDAKPGSYNVYATPTYGSMTVDPAEDTEDGVVDGLVRVSLGAGSATLTIVCDHAWGEWTQTEAPTCTKVGKETRTCSKCGATETRDVAMVEHKWSDWKQTKAPTCTAKGEETRECSVCHKTETRAVDMIEHDWATGWTTDKNNHWHVCTVCGEKADEGAHKFHWIIDRKASATQTGLKHEECEVCHYKRNVGTVIPKVEGLDDVPQTGDVTPYIALGFLSMISMVAAAAYVIKRKFAK